MGGGAFASDVGIRADVDSLDYNLLALRLSGRNATLTAAARGGALLFPVDACRIDLPWTTPSGRIALGQTF